MTSSRDDDPLPDLAGTNPLGYADLKALAGELRRPLHALLALSDDNDPFLADRPGRRHQGAEWFAELWERLDIPDGVHLRRLHYLLVSTTAITLPNGQPYLNTHKCWKLLGACAADARFLDLVPAEAFVDRRAPEPIVYILDDEPEEGRLYVYGNEPHFPARSEHLLPAFEPKEVEFPLLPCPLLNKPKLAEPYALELWDEKSTQNDILLPLAQQERVTLVTGVGEMSITQCLALVRRVREHQRPTRILYLSDFDPAGDGMPTSVARKIEYFLRRDGDDLDIKLIPILLTAEQVADFNLPRVPIKESDKRRAAFEGRHGEGAVELDALEALHPGALARIVRDAIDRYRAPKRRAEREIAELAADINREIAEIRERVLDEHTDEIAELRTSFEQAQSEITDRQDAIVAVAEHEQAIAQRLEQWHQEAAPTWKNITDEIETALPDLNEIEWPEPEEVDDDALFDSSRSYLEQIEHYKRRKNGGGATGVPQ